MKTHFKGQTTQLKATIIGITGERNDGAEGKSRQTWQFNTSTPLWRICTYMYGRSSKEPFCFRDILRQNVTRIF